MTTTNTAPKLSQEERKLMEKINAATAQHKSKQTSLLRRLVACQLVVM